MDLNHCHISTFFGFMRAEVNQVCSIISSVESYGVYFQTYVFKLKERVGVGGVRVTSWLTEGEIVAARISGVRVTNWLSVCGFF